MSKIEHVIFAADLVASMKNSMYVHKYGIKIIFYSIKFIAICKIDSYLQWLLHNIQRKFGNR